MPTQVPPSYQPYVALAAKGTGLPADVVAAQANMESGFNSQAVSPTGAEGWLQFEPSTYDSVAPRAGVKPGTEFDVASETKAYVTYMNDLLAQEGGSVFKALEAYNAGPGNLPAGAGYATTILSNAGQTSDLQSGKPAVLTGINWNIPGDIQKLIGGAEQNLYGNALGSVGSSILSGLGLGSLKDLLQRLGIMLLGVAILLVGINMLTNGKSVEVIKDAAGKAAMA